MFLTDKVGSSNRFKLSLNRLSMTSCLQTPLSLTSLLLFGLALCGVFFEKKIVVVRLSQTESQVWFFNMCVHVCVCVFIKLYCPNSCNNPPLPPTHTQRARIKLVQRVMAIIF